MMRTPCGVFCILIYLGKYGWVACQFILDIILFLGWVGKVRFFFVFQVCQSSRVV